MVSFLGFGDPKAISWGQLLYFNYESLKVAPWASIAPSAAIFITVLGFRSDGQLSRLRRSQSNQLGPTPLFQLRVTEGRALGVDCTQRRDLHHRARLPIGWSAFSASAIPKQSAGANSFISITSH